MRTAHQFYQCVSGAAPLCDGFAALILSRVMAIYEAETNPFLIGSASAVRLSAPKFLFYFSE